MIPADIRNVIITVIVFVTLSISFIAYVWPTHKFIEPVAYCQATAGVVGGEYYPTDFFAPCRDVLRQQDI